MYRREFEIAASDLGRRITVEFDGVFAAFSFSSMAVSSAATTMAMYPSVSTSPILLPMGQELYREEPTPYGGGTGSEPGVMLSSN
jgi:hypothetical protein